MTKILQFFIPFISIFVFSQNDTIQRQYNYKKLNFGIDYDFKNSIVGFSVNNGIEVKPLIHFEDFSDRFLYKLSFRTNFEKDFALETVLAYALNNKIINQVGIDSKYYNYKSTLRLKDIGISATKFINPLQLDLILRPTFQELNNCTNFGFEVGVRKVLIYEKLYYELRFGHYSNYNTYNFLLQSFIYKNKLGLNASFEKIDQFQFFKVGLNFVISKKVIF